MNVSPHMMKWILRFYPPFLFQRIWVKSISNDYKTLEIKVFKSLFNINSNKTIFGGTIFSAVDPVYPLLLNAILLNKGLKKTIVWLKSASIDYIKPGNTSLQLNVRISDEEIEDAFSVIKKEGKVLKTFHSEIINKHGEVCATAHSEVYLRDLSFIKKEY